MAPPPAQPSQPSQPLSAPPSQTIAPTTTAQIPSAVTATFKPPTGLKPLPTVEQTPTTPPAGHTSIGANAEFHPVQTGTIIGTTRGPMAAKAALAAQQIRKQQNTQNEPPSGGTAIASAPQPPTRYEQQAPTVPGATPRRKPQKNYSALIFGATTGGGIFTSILAGWGMGGSSDDTTMVAFKTIKEVFLAFRRYLPHIFS